MRIVFALLFLWQLMGCRSLLRDRYDINATTLLVSRTAYREKLDAHPFFRSVPVLYPDEQGFVELVRLKQDLRNPMVCLGLYPDDSTRWAFSETLHRKAYCQAELFSEIRRRLGDGGRRAADTVRLSQPLKRYGLRDLRGGQASTGRGEHKGLQVVLTYTLSAGTYYDRLFRDLLALQRQYPDRLGLTVILLDPLYAWD